MAEAMQKQTYEHKGVTITFEPMRGDFTAAINGKTVRAASIKAMQKRIDDALSSAFQPFDGIRWYLRGSDFVRVTGVEKNDRRTGYVFSLEWKRSADHSHVSRAREPVITIDTPENRALVQAMQDRMNEIESAYSKGKEEVEALRLKIPTISANDYGTKGAK